jgi:hypothetical protein
MGVSSILLDFDFALMALLCIDYNDVLPWGVLGNLHMFLGLLPLLS